MYIFFIVYYFFSLFIWSLLFKTLDHMKIKNTIAKIVVLSLLCTHVLPYSLFSTTYAAWFNTDCTDITTTEVSQLECEALESMYNSLDGDSWTDNTNWGTTWTSVKTWFGLEFVWDDLTKVHLFENNLSGTLPSEIWNLSNVQHLFLSGNNISGSIPPEIGDIATLTHLRLDVNSMSWEIPASFSNLTNLNEVRLHRNSFSGTLDNLSTQPNLNYMYLEENDFHGEIPSWITSRVNMRVFRGNINHFTWPAPEFVSTWMTIYKINDNHFDHLESDVDKNAIISNTSWYDLIADRARDSQSFIPVSIEQSSTQDDPTTVNSVIFDVVFDESMDVSTFSWSDITFSWSSTAFVSSLVEGAPSDWTSFSMTVTGIASWETVKPILDEGKVLTLLWVKNYKSSSTDNSVEYTGVTNSAPTDIIMANNSIQGFAQALNQLTQSIVVDVDESDTHTYSFCGWEDDSFFAIDNNNITIAQDIDFHNPLDSDWDNVYDYCITADDWKGWLYSENFSVYVTQKFDYFPVTISLAVWQEYLTESSTAHFSVEFSEDINVSTLEISDFTLTGSLTATIWALTQVNILDDTKFEIEVENIWNNETLTIYLQDKSVENADSKKLNITLVEWNGNSVKAWDKSTRVFNSDGEMLAAWWNWYWQIWNEVTSTSSSYTLFEQSQSREDILFIWKANNTSCYINTEGKIYCWWNGSSYAKWNWSTSSSTSKTIVTDSSWDIALQLDTGYNKSCAVYNTWKVKCWWRDFFSSYNSAAEKYPTEIPGISNAVKVAVWSQSACALISDWTVQCWWKNYKNVIWNSLISSNGSVTTPVFADGITEARDIVAWDAVFCVTLNDNWVKCWGISATWLMGEDNASNYAWVLPTRLENVSDVKKLDVWIGSQYACYTNSENELHCYGYNNPNWILGNGTTWYTFYYDPVKILDDVADFSVWDVHSCAFKIDWELLCWWTNSTGQFWDNSFTTSSLPTPSLFVWAPQWVSVKVSIPNNLPTDITIDNLNIDENSAISTVIWEFSSEDLDVTDTHSYTFVTWTWSEDNSYFSISWDELLLNFVPDFENPLDTWDTLSNNTYSVRVQSEDSGGWTFEKIFIITINDLDDTAPVAPVITSHETGDYINNGTPTIEWTGEMWAIVSLTIWDVTFTWTVDTSWNWSIAIPEWDNIPDDNYDIVATQSDSAWNISPETEENITVDSIKPVVSFLDWVDATALITDTINISVVDDNIDVTTLKYWLVDSVSECSESYSGTLGFSHNITFDVISDSTNGKFICAVAEDLAWNRWYAISSDSLEIDLPPVIELIWSASVEVEKGTSYVDDWANSLDEIDGTESLIWAWAVDTSTPWTYYIKYNDSDTSNQPAPEVIRTVVVVDTINPGSPTLDTPKNTSVVTGTAEPWSSVNLVAVTSGAVCDTTATVEWTYTCDMWVTALDGEDVVVTSTDASWNYASSYNEAVFDFILPELDLIWGADITHEVWTVYTDAHAQYNDNVDWTGIVETLDEVTHTMLWVYILNYSYTDSSWNIAEPVKRIVKVVDTKKPVISVVWNQNIIHEFWTTYNDAGAWFTDNVDLTWNVSVVSNVDINTVWTYTVVYNYTDSSWNIAETVTRTVTIVDSQKPILSLIWSASITHEVWAIYTDEWAQFNDNVDSTWTVATSDIVDVDTLWNYTLTYSYTDSAGNVTEDVQRIVTVVDTQKPLITVIGDMGITHEFWTTYTDEGALFTDNVDGTWSTLVIDNTDSTKLWEYSVVYDYTDTSWNKWYSVMRTVKIVDSTPPVLSLIWSEVITHEFWRLYTDEWAQFSDAFDWTWMVVTGDSVDVNTVWEYVLTYTYTDANGNIAEPVSRTVRVLDVEAPTTIEWSLGLEITEDSAVISWETSEKTSTQLIYGLTTVVDNQTEVTDIAPRVTSHTSTLTDLKHCTKYYYYTVSVDVNWNEAREWIYDFVTRWCSWDADVVSVKDVDVVLDVEWTTEPIVLQNEWKEVAVEVPDGFATSYLEENTCNGEWAYFQFKEIDKVAVEDSLWRPEDKGLTVRTYDLSAYCTPSQRITNFDKEIVVTSNYLESELGSEDENNLAIFRYNEDTSAWQELKDCTVNTENNTVSCTTNHFSTFGVFALETEEEVVEEEVIVSRWSSWSSSSSTYTVACKMTNLECSTSGVYVMKSWMSCEWWLLWQSCTPNKDTFPYYEVSDDSINDTSWAEEDEEQDFSIVQNELISELTEELIWEDPVEKIIVVENILDETDIDVAETYDSCPILRNIHTLWYEDNFVSDLSDIDDNSLAHLILRLERAGIVDGSVSGEFEADRHMSRIEFIKIVLRSHCIEYRNEDTSALSFDDLDNATWQAKVAKKSLDLWIAHWDFDDDGTPIFRADEEISKIEATKILMNMAIIENDGVTTSTYSDIGGSWYVKYVAHGEYLNIFDPEADNHLFRPEWYVTREAMVDLLYRVTRLYKNTTLIAQ